MELCMSAYCLAASGSRQDRSAEIEDMLQRNSICWLGSGEFYVSGVTMPEHSSIRGMGSATKLILMEEVQDGAAINMGSFCSVQDLHVTGAPEDLVISETVGKRHGIAFAGNAIPEDRFIDPAAGIISNCLITNFAGGGLFFWNTGYNDRCSTTVTNCQILCCGAGINIAHFSEYHKFTNVTCHHCLYGCINNGGNNMFVNCGFTSNVTGFLMDNSLGRSKNNSHGSVVGCTFNHSDKNEGIGIQILNVKNGYVFTGCQMFYSKIVVEDAPGIVIDSFNFGRGMDISVKGESFVSFSNSVFASQPATVAVTDGAKVKFSNCHTFFGEVVKEA